MFFIGGGGRGGLSADNTPAQRKTPLKTPPNPPPFFKFGSGGVLSMISNFRESRPPVPVPISHSCTRCTVHLPIYHIAPGDYFFQQQGLFERRR